MSSDSPGGPDRTLPRRGARVRKQPDRFQSRDFRTFLQQHSQLPQDCLGQSKVEVVLKVYSVFLDFQKAMFAEVIALLGSE